MKNEESPATRKLKIRRGPDGFGITLTKGKTSDDIKGYFVTHLSPLSPVSQVSAGFLAVYCSKFEYGESFFY